ncbi:type II toxin-antitoxin system VapC family toxin [Chamaesiphon sp. VAR_48_metabat_403]|uniref:type II toxin-antitoxin system VapC family toxin n=1 Tax=Chamaesiphon sp. VAR_48_metabat_403 TaxID=2964700 RepID=UPI00286E5293|nr:type II toxin-antitoxin system VapC family toxin [Chamaesiphon sp. VAR_48_metabat_403]
MKIVLDTNVLSELMKPQGLTKVKNWVAAQPRENLFTTSITQAEILYGIAILPDGKRSQALREAAQRMFVEDFSSQIISFEQTAAICFAEIAANRKKIGKPIAQADAQIAAICLANNALIATRNVDDFVDCQIEIFNPWDL